VWQELGLPAPLSPSAVVPSTPPVAANVVAETTFQDGLLKIDMYGTQESVGSDGKQFVVRWDGRVVGFLDERPSCVFHS
jgi:hypothetical protein